MVAVFLRLAQRSDAAGNLPVFFRSHPYSADRARAVRELYQKLQAAEPMDKLYVGRQNLKQRVPRAEREFDH